MNLRKRSLNSVSGKTLVLGLLVSCTALSSAMALDHDQKQTAQGLAKIVSSAPSCGFEIDTPALEAYYAKSGLDTPEGLAYFSNMMTIFSGNSSDKSACALTKTTARSIGILQD